MTTKTAREWEKIKQPKKSIFDLNYSKELCLDMLGDGTVEAMMRDGWGELEESKSPEHHAAWLATKEYCEKYIKRFAAEGDGAWQTLGDLSASLSMFFDGYLSKAKGEIVLYG